MDPNLQALLLRRIWTPFDCRSIRIEQWYSAIRSATTQSGGLVSQWNDLSGAGRHLTASGTDRPTWNVGAIATGKPSMQCGGSCAMTASVANRIAGNVGSGGSTSDLGFDFPGSTDFYNNVTSPIPSVSVMTTTRLLVLTWDMVGWELWCDGAMTTSAAWSVQPTAPGTWWAVIKLIDAGNFGFGRFVGTDGVAGGTLMLFNRNDKARGLNGYCGEQGFADGKVSTAEMPYMSGYLAHEWGLRGNLANAHRFKNSPPMAYAGRWAPNENGLLAPRDRRLILSKAA